jgi:hypothetical protein
MATLQNTAGVQEIVPGTLAVDINPTPTNTTQDLVLGGPFPLPTTTASTVPTSAFTIV